LVTELNPKYFVLENVKGLTQGSHRHFLAEVLWEFDRRGYRVREDYQVLNAGNYGVPQSRERLFLLGCRADLPLPSYPCATTQIPKSPKRLLCHLPHGPTVWEAIADLPEVTQFPELWDRDTCYAEYGMPLGTYAATLRGWQRDREDYSYIRPWNPRLLTNSLRTRHSAECMQRFEETPAGSKEPVSRFLRLDPHGVSNTLRAGTASNRGAFTSPRPIHPFQPRCITVREAARLHSYPDWFRFHSTKWHGFRQIGNSVPPLLAKAVAQELMRVLEGRSPCGGAPVAAGAEPMLHWSMAEAAHSFAVHPHTIEPRTRPPRSTSGLGSSSGQNANF
jgi:DNA (cytosine-5)-methyltransferase 1